MEFEDAVNRFYYEYSLYELRQMNQEQLDPSITYNSLLYLDLISYREQCTASQLAELLHISKSAVAVKLAELIRQGLVQKTQSESDKRVYYLSVTPKVAENYAQYDRKLQKAKEEISARFTEQEIDTFCQILSIITKYNSLEGDRHE